MSSRYIYLIFLLILIKPNIAFAYIDPSIFSFLWQGLVLIIASAAVSVKIFWNKILDIIYMFRSKSKGKKTEK